jgi:hypothetical protein
VLFCVANNMRRSLSGIFFRNCCCNLIQHLQEWSTPSRLVVRNIDDFTGMICCSSTCACNTGFLVEWFWLSHRPCIKSAFCSLVIFVSPATLWVAMICNWLSWRNICDHWSLLCYYVTKLSQVMKKWSLNEKALLLKCDQNVEQNHIF